MLRRSSRTLNQKNLADHSLVEQRNAGTQSQPQQPQGPPPGVTQSYPGSIPTPQQSGFSLPQPTNSGSLDISNIRPVNTGSVSLNDALSKARAIATEKGVYDSGRFSTAHSRLA